MYNFKTSDELERKIKKLSKKDRPLYQQIIKKIKEVINSGDIGHYKNIRSPMNEFKRVHVGSFVLIFRYDKKNDLIIFDDFDHHDNVYK